MHVQGSPSVEKTARMLHEKSIQASNDFRWRRQEDAWVRIEVDGLERVTLRNRKSNERLWIDQGIVHHKNEVSVVKLHDLHSCVWIEHRVVSLSSAPDSVAHDSTMGKREPQ